MTSGPELVELATMGRGNDPAAAVAPSPAVLAAQARLEELRRAAGIATRQQSAADDLDQGQGAKSAASRG